MKVESFFDMLFRILTVVFLFLALGTLGAWETGMIGFLSMVMRTSLYIISAYYCIRVNPYPARIRRRRSTHRVVMHPKRSANNHTQTYHAC